MKYLLNHLELKILALISAITLWLFVVGFENNSFRFPEEINIQAVNVPQDLSLTADLGTATLRIRTDQDVLKNLTKSDFDVTVDLKNAKAGSQEIPVTTTSKNDKVTILKVDPATVRVSLEPVSQKEVKIRTVVTGNPQKGYTVKDETLSRQTATVSGGKSLVDKISEVVAEINLDGSETTNFKQNITLEVADSTNRLLKTVSIVPDQVVADVTIESELQQKSVIVKPDLQGSIDLVIMSMKLQVTPLTVIVQGKEDVLNTLNDIQTEPVLVETLKVNGIKGVTTKLVLPKGVSLLDSEENSILVSLTAPS
jgi:YbbR domain-containing protein